MDEPIDPKDAEIAALKQLLRDVLNCGDTVYWLGSDLDARVTAALGDLT